MARRVAFEEKLRSLHQDLIEMQTLVEKSMDDTIKALKTHDVKMANAVIERDDEIDEMELKIERKCLAIIAGQQPMASDLRDIVGVLKIITDLERIADHCSDISKYTIKLADETYVKPLIRIPKMAEEVKIMINNVIDCWIDKDISKAKEVLKHDDIVDKYFEDIVEELIGIMESTPETTRQCTYFIFIAKYLERMGDHATNIAEWIGFTVTGDHTQVHDG
ncbi:phosphate transport system protein [Dethiosulfatibacter aminovorans DSM 17477]|uniref:Phosphate-specific transport system accessory protein PhoU n=1 Tax=Dethiosulfatibacter aminovorans DSM 17477 TaxID=1121476 RepID=A0A1M6I3J7_9FIRM|nr:phosphate signaling complex protein PhoU [Dethiosulfatibacter aminovorans]SHJ28982.1 phosphate transport system protein [Dethiosulfatibacter aminovorans DSM 17477]